MENNIATDTRFRRNARRIMKTCYPNLDWDLYLVHHIDGDPRNNRLVNLKIVLRREHMGIHHAQEHCIYCSRELYNGECLCGRQNPSG